MTEDMKLALIIIIVVIVLIVIALIIKSGGSLDFLDDIGDLFDD